MAILTQSDVSQTDKRTVAQLPLPPGFRFSPTDEELVWHYLRKKADSEPFKFPVIAEVNLYKFDPWDLPGLALFGEKEWFFFSPRDRKYPKGARPNRAAASGYWKATGTDKPILMAQGGPGGQKVGVKKSLVFYRGRAPKGDKTNWIMHEYRLAEGVAQSVNQHRRGSMRLDDWVLCRIYQKPTHAKGPGCEHDVMESLLPSLPEIDDSGLQNSLAGEPSTAALVESMLGGDDSQNGSLTTSLPMMNCEVVSNLQTSAALSSEWGLQQDLATMSHHNLGFMPELQALGNMRAMADQFRHHRSYNSLNYVPDLVDQYNAMPITGRSSISDEESQISSQYGLDSMYPTLGYDHRADQSTASYTTSGVNPVQPSARIPGSFEFSYGPGPANSYFLN